MSAREEIFRLVNQYCFAIDTGDLDGFASMFEHGEWVIEGAERYVGKHGLLELASNILIYEDGSSTGERRASG